MRAPSRGRSALKEVPWSLLQNNSPRTSIWAPSARPKSCKKRIWFTLGALLVYRLGTYIPMPGIDPASLAQIFSDKQRGILGMFNLFAGGAIGRMAIFALNIMPYICLDHHPAAHLGGADVRAAEEGRRGRPQEDQPVYALWHAIPGGHSVLRYRRRPRGLRRRRADPGWFFRISTVVTLVGGTMFLMWLGEQITQRGVGNGISLIIFAGIVAELPAALLGILEAARTGAMSTFVYSPCWPAVSP